MNSFIYIYTELHSNILIEHTLTLIIFSVINIFHCPKVCCNVFLCCSRFDEDRTPETWLGNAGPQDRYDPSDVIMARGVARGVNG